MLLLQELGLLMEPLGGVGRIAGQQLFKGLDVVHAVRAPRSSLAVRAVWIHGLHHLLVVEVLHAHRGVGAIHMLHLLLHV